MIAPLAVLLLGVVLIVARGLGRDGDATGNHARGGGSADQHDP